VEFALLAKAFVLGVVEGLTEFLPISSTGHLILVGELLGFTDEKAKVFEIVIQTGAMFAVVWEYRARFGRVLAGLITDRAAQRFALNLLVAFTPAAVLGLAFGKLIKTYLFHAVPVALAFIAGAFIILWVERRRRAAVIQNVDEMTWKDALKVGIAQAFALIPGTSRSGATIIGGPCRRSWQPAHTISGRTARSSLRAMWGCSRSARSRRSCPLSFAYVGCCATSPRTTSRRSHGTGSLSAQRYSLRPTRESSIGRRDRGDRALL